MPHSRTCPVCLTPGSIIRPDAKTCSRDCSKIWNKMPISEQHARLAAVDPAQQAEKLHKATFIDEVVDEDAFNEDMDKATESMDSMPEGIIPK